MSLAGSTSAVACLTLFHICTGLVVISSLDGAVEGLIDFFQADTRCILEASPEELVYSSAYMNISSPNLGLKHGETYFLSLSLKVETTGHLTWHANQFYSYTPEGVEDFIQKELPYLTFGAVACPLGEASVELKNNPISITSIIENHSLCPRLDNSVNLPPGIYSYIRCR